MDETTININPEIMNRPSYPQPQSMQDMILPGEPLLDQDVNGSVNNSVGLGSNVTIDDSDTFLYPTGTDITKNMQDVSAILQYFHRYILVKYQIKRDYYKGRHRSIIERARQNGVDFDNDNRIVNPFPKKLVDTMTRYDTSNPVQITCDSGDETVDNSINTQLSEWMSSVDFAAQHQRLIKNACLYGRSYLYIYNDKLSNQLELSVCDPTNTIVVYDNTVAKHPLFAIRDNSNGDEYNGELITVDGVYEFSASSAVGKAGQPAITNTKLFGNADKPQSLPNLPIVEMNIKDEKMGIFDDVITLIDEINETLSTKANDRAAMSLYYMIITGMELSEDQMNQIKRMHIANVYNPDADEENGSVNKPSLDFKSPVINDELQEHILDRFEHLVFKNSGVLDIYDASVGNNADANSGVAIQKMYSEMQSNAKAIDNNFDELSNLIMAIFFESLGIDADNTKFLSYVHTPDDPVNVSEQADNFNKLPENMPTQDRLNISGLGGTNSKQLADKMDKENENTNNTIAKMVSNNLNQQPSGTNGGGNNDNSNSSGTE